MGLAAEHARERRLVLLPDAAAELAVELVLQIAADLLLAAHPPAQQVRRVPG